MQLNWSGGLSRRPRPLRLAFAVPGSGGYDGWDPFRRSGFLLRFGGQFGDPDMPIMVGSRDLQAVRLQVDVAGQIRQGEAVKIFVGVGLPETNRSARPEKP